MKFSRFEKIGLGFIALLVALALGAGFFQYQIAHSVAPEPIASTAVPAGPALTQFMLSAKLSCIKSSRLSRKMADTYCDCVAVKSGAATTQADLDWITQHHALPDGYDERVVAPIKHVCSTAK